MKKGKAGIFTLSTTSIIVVECLISIIMIFLDTFLVSKILKMDPGNYTNVALFNFIYYAMIALVSLVSAPILIKFNKGVFMSIGAFLLSGIFLVVFFLGDNLVNWIWLLGVACGLTYGIFYSGFNALLAEAVSSKNQTIYFSVKNILIFLTKTIFPLVLGSIISQSFPAICIILAVVCLLIFIFSFFIKGKKTNAQQEFNLLRYLKVVRNGGENTKPLKTLYISGFFRGLSFDLISTVLTILVFMQSEGNDFTIGLVQSIFTAAQLISMFIFMKTYHKRLAHWFIFVSLTLIIGAAIPVFINPCLVTVLIFYGVYYFFRLFITTITDMRRSSLIRILSMHKYILEHNAVYAMVAGMTRACAYLLLMLCLVIPDAQLMIDIVLGVNLLGYVGYSISLFCLERQLIAQDLKWKSTHPEGNKQIEEKHDPQVIDVTPEVKSIEKEIRQQKKTAK